MKQRCFMLASTITHTHTQCQVIITESAWHQLSKIMYIISSILTVYHQRASLLHDINTMHIPDYIVFNDLSLLRFQYYSVSLQPDYKLCSWCLHNLLTRITVRFFNFSSLANNKPRPEKKKLSTWINTDDGMFFQSVSIIKLITCAKFRRKLY